MKRTLYTSIFLLCLFVGNAFAQVPKGKEFGVGIIAGEPTGVALKYWLNNNALTANVCTSYFGSLRFDVGYSFHFNTFGSRFVKTYFNSGFALGIGQGKAVLFDSFRSSQDETRLGLRLAIGINVLLARTPIEFFLEGATVRNMGSGGSGGLDAAIGVRWYL